MPKTKNNTKELKSKPKKPTTKQIIINKLTKEKTAIRKKISKRWQKKKKKKEQRGQKGANKVNCKIVDLISSISTITLNVNGLIKKQIGRLDLTQLYITYKKLILNIKTQRD